MTIEGATEKQKSKRPRGTGSIYHKSGSRYWWVCYYVNGKPVYESTGSEKITDARNFLKGKIAKAETGNFVSPKVQRISVAELFDAVLTDYRNNGKAIGWAERVWKLHLEPFFGQMRAANIGTDQIASYVAKRKAEKEPAANATINRELALLRRAFTLGYKAKPRKVTSLLDLSEHMLEESNVRTGFVDEAQYKTLADKAAGQLWLRAMLALGYTYGFRKAELLNMRVGQVDLLGRTIRLNPGETKNGEGRIVTLTDACYFLVVELMRGKQLDDYLLTRQGGEPVRDFRGAWAALTEAVNMPGLLFHDLRRSAVRNMVRRGVTERVAMRISGHKSRSVFDRYDIVSESDLADAALKVERGAKAELARESVIDSLLTDAQSCSTQKKGEKPEVSVRM
jgi:integrase